jgi:uncharacterized secreted protein with C-terminal beta-propeller domain
MRTSLTGARGGLIHGVIAAALAIVGGLVPGTAATGGPEATAGLTPFTSCEALRQWYVEHSIGQVGPAGWDAPVFALRAPVPEAGAHLDAATTGTLDAVGNSPTGTNTQETGVDEPDVAKTDGRIVVQVRGRELVVTDASGAVARQLATWPLPRGVVAGGLLLVDGHVLLTATQPLATEDGAFAPDLVRSESTDLFDLDVTDPSTPRLVGHSTWSGSALSMRQYGDTVRLVTSTGLPALPFVHPHRGLSRAGATARNQEIVRAAAIDAWLPSLRVDGSSRRAVDCASTFHADSGAALDAITTIGVFTLHPGVTSPVSAVAVTGSGSQVYSSTDRLYVWSTDAGLPLRRPLATGRPLLAVPRTVVHAFAIDGDETRYVASGRVDGEARDSWSFDEHDGHLRIALSWPGRLPVLHPEDATSSVGSGSDNGIVVLDEEGGRLVTVGALRGLGRGEDIQSVRWFDDLAVLVTFRQTDPLYTVDVGDPAHPRALGALHLPGFSSYLHPIGDGRLLGLGTSATADGQAEGAKAAVFDLRDASAVRQLGEAGLGHNTWLQVANDPHTFTWLPASDGTGTAITQLEGTADGVGLVALRVSEDGSITADHLQGAGGWAQRALPLDDGRVALVGSRVVIMALGG